MNNKIIKIRNILNVLFMIGAFASIILYFTSGDDRTVFFYVCCTALVLKMVEFILRFIRR